MTIVYYVILTLHIVACLFLITVVLLQQGKGQDLASAFGGGGTQAAFGPRGSANLLSRTTTVLAGVFMLTSLSLSVLRPHQASVLDQVPAAQESRAPAAGEPVPAAPASEAPAPDSVPAADTAPAGETAPPSGGSDQP